MGLTLNFISRTEIANKHVMDKRGEGRRGRAAYLAFPAGLRSLLFGSLVKQKCFE